MSQNRFFKLLSRYRKNPDNFSIQYVGRTINLKIETDLIKVKEVPIKHYNYSYIKDLLEQKYNQKVSLPTIIDRAKKNNFYFSKPERKAHEREILTDYSGELIQHDSSHHQFSKYANKCYPITSLDDYILYAVVLVERETTWTNIIALKVVILDYVVPYSYYVDNYSVFHIVDTSSYISFKLSSTASL